MAGEAPVMLGSGLWAGFRRGLFGRRSEYLAGTPGSVLEEVEEAERTGDDGAAHLLRMVAVGIAEADLAKDPADWVSWYWKGRALDGLGKCEEAAEAYRSSMHHNTGEAGTWRMQEETEALLAVCEKRLRGQ